MIRLRIRTVMIGLTTLAVALGLIRSKLAPVRGDQSALTDTIIMCLHFCGSIAAIGNNRSPRLGFALVTLLSIVAILFF